jgi:hypothetical protein
MSSSGRIADDLDVESFLLEVEDGDLTEAGLAQKLKTPKFTETFVKRLRMLAEKYELQGQPSAGSASGASSSGSTVASGSAKSGGEKDGGEKGNTTEPRAATGKHRKERPTLRRGRQACRTPLHSPARRSQKVGRRPKSPELIEYVYMYLLSTCACHTLCTTCIFKYIQS